MVKKEIEQHVKEYVKGNKDAFNYIYDNSYKLIYMVAYNVVKSKSAAEDIMQDTYRNIIQNISEYKSTNFLAWATTIARNLAYNYYHKKNRETLSDFNEDQTFDKLVYEEDTNIGLFAKAKEILSDEDYQILVLIIVVGYKRREISLMLDIPVSTVSYKYKMALKALKKYAKEDM